MNREIKPLMDYAIPEASRKIRNFGTNVLSRVTGLSTYDLTRKRPSLADKLGSKLHLKKKSIANKMN